jgi:hypothetical protein
MPKKSYFHRTTNLMFFGLTIRDLKKSGLLYSSNCLLTTRFNRRFVRLACRPWRGHRAVRTKQTFGTALLGVRLSEQLRILCLTCSIGVAAASTADS